MITTTPTSTTTVTTTTHTWPTVAVVMPIRNEEAFIHKSLGAILGQDYPKDKIEVLVIDGLSTDKTRDIIVDLQRDHPNLRLLDNPAQIVPPALNIAIKEASSDIIVRVDGHTIIAPDYVRQCVVALQESDAANVGGKMTAIGKTPFGEAVALATSTPFGVGGARFHYSDDEEYVDTVYLGAWWRRTFDEIGGFDEELVRDQDDEFNYRLRKHGGRILLRPMIKSIYTVRGTPRKLWRQYYQYGFWKVRVLQKHPGQMRPRQFIPPLFAFSLLFSLILALLHPLGIVLLAAAASAYILANLTASFWTARNHSWKHLRYLPLIFAFLHLGYGFGFLMGLFRFAHRWRE